MRSLHMLIIMINQPCIPPFWTRLSLPVKLPAPDVSSTFYVHIILPLPSVTLLPFLQPLETNFPGFLITQKAYWLFDPRKSIHYRVSMGGMPETRAAGQVLPPTAIDVLVSITFAPGVLVVQRENGQDKKYASYYVQHPWFCTLSSSS